eukprot:140933_1
MSNTRSESEQIMFEVESVYGSGSVISSVESDSDCTSSSDESGPSSFGESGSGADKSGSNESGSGDQKCIIQQRSADLLRASEFGDVLAVRRLLGQSDIDVNIFSSEFLSPLYLAVKGGHTEIVRLLSENPTVDVNVQCIDDGEICQIPLYLAVKLR